MERARIAAVSYLNTVPLIHGLDGLADIELSTHAPARIGVLVRRGQADVGLASLIDAADHERADDALTLLACGMIGCDGPTLTVRLFSDVPMREVRTLHADTESRTSVVLAQVVLDALHGIRPTVVPFDAKGLDPAGDPNALPSSLLLIGDKAVGLRAPAGRHAHQLDLGEAWKGITGMPFVYAMWMCRADRSDDPTIRVAAELLHRQRLRNQARLGWLIQTAAPRFGWSPALARRYLAELLRFDVGERELAAAAEFVRRAHALGLCRHGTLGRVVRCVQGEHVIA